MSLDMGMLIMVQNLVRDAETLGRINYKLSAESKSSGVKLAEDIRAFAEALARDGEAEQRYGNKREGYLG